MNALLAWDHDVFLIINGMGTAWLDPVMLLFSATYFWVSVAVLIFIVALVQKKAELIRFLIVVLLGIAVADAVAYQIMKPYFARVRPCHIMTVRLVTDGCGSQNGFPSNHAANAMVVCSAVFFLLPKKMRGMAFVLCSLVALSRVYLGVHYPGDVLFGSLLGLLVGAVASRLDPVLKYCEDRLRLKFTRKVE